MRSPRGRWILPQAPTATSVGIERPFQKQRRDLCVQPSALNESTLNPCRIVSRSAPDFDRHLSHLVTMWDRGQRLGALRGGVDWQERSMWIAYRGIRVRKYHRPLSTYFRALLGCGLVLPHFDEPGPSPDAPAQKADRYRRAPWFLVMEWRKPIA